VKLNEAMQQFFWVYFSLRAITTMTADAAGMNHGGKRHGIWETVAVTNSGAVWLPHQTQIRG
jgi:hypothetical protein